MNKLLDKFWKWADQYDWTTFKVLYEDCMIAVTIICLILLYILFYTKF